MKMPLQTLSALAILAAIVGGCDKQASAEDPLAVSAAAMGLAFPASATVLGYRHLKDPANTRYDLFPMPDDAIWLKVEIDRADLGAFMSGPPLGGVTWRDDSRFEMAGSTDAAWWNPEAPAAFKAAEVPLPKGQPKGRVLRVLVDNGSSHGAIVYLHWFEL